jgi:hypothetical protein
MAISSDRLAAQAAADAGELASARATATADQYRQTINRLTERRWIVMQAVEAAKTLKLDEPADFRMLCEMIDGFILGETPAAETD